MYNEHTGSNFPKHILITGWYSSVCAKYKTKQQITNAGASDYKHREVLYTSHRPGDIQSTHLLYVASNCYIYIQRCSIAICPMHFGAQKSIVTCGIVVM